MTGHRCAPRAASRSVSTDPIAGCLGPIDTLVVVGGRRHRRRRVRRRPGSVGAGRGAPVATGHVGVHRGVRPGRAGLLDGQRATTHWSECARLADAFPAVTVEPDPIFVRDGDVWTSAGVTAGHGPGPAPGRGRPRPGPGTHAWRAGWCCSCSGPAARPSSASSSPRSARRGTRSESSRPGSPTTSATTSASRHWRGGAP